MAWRERVNDDPLSWLLEPESPAVRHLALRDLVGLPIDDPQVAEARGAAHRVGPIAAVLDAMSSEGWWVAAGPGYSPKYRSTAWSVILLAQLGASARADERVARACAYVLDHARTDAGQFTISGAPSGTVDCLQGNLCWALATLGCADPRLDRAYDWMARSVTGDGIAPRDARDAPLRYYAYKCGPGFACGANDRQPCAWGAAKVMTAFSVWPIDRRTPQVSAAIDAGVEFLLGTDPATAAYPSPYGPRPSGNWWKLGFPVFYVTDILQIVEALASLGRGGDPRLAAALDVVCGKQDADGRWALEYDYAGKTWADFGPKRQPSKWVTLRALRALKRVG